MEDNNNLVEKMGLFLEKRGYSPIAGRVFALLLLSDPPHQDFYSIQESIKADKSSISNALNLLIDLERVDYITFRGDRKRYFKINPAMWLDKIKSDFHELNSFNVLLEEILAKRNDSGSSEFHIGLKEVLVFLNFYKTEFEASVQKWETQKNNK